MHCSDLLAAAHAARSAWHHAYKPSMQSSCLAAAPHRQTSMLLMLLGIMHNPYLLIFLARPWELLPCVYHACHQSGGRGQIRAHCMYILDPCACKSCEGAAQGLTVQCRWRRRAGSRPSPSEARCGGTKAALGFHGGTCSSPMLSAEHMPASKVPRGLLIAVSSCFVQAAYANQGTTHALSG